MTDPKDTVSTQTLAADELPDELLDRVAGGDYPDGPCPYFVT
jgi:hypothetical protein